MRLRGIPVEFAGSLLRVLCDVDQNRPRAARSRHIERFADRSRHFIGVRHQIVVLRDGQRDAGDVGFLKGVGADQLAADLPRDAHDWRRIEHRRRNACDHIGRAGPGGSNRDADLPAGASESIGHVRRTLLVAHEDVMDLAVLERVVCRQNCTTGIAEHVLHTLALDAFPQNACSGHVLASHLVRHSTLLVDLISPKKQNPPSQRFWRGGIGEPSGFLVSQLTASLHTVEGTIIRTLQTVPTDRCRYAMIHSCIKGKTMVSKAIPRRKGESLAVFPARILAGLRS